MIGVEKGLIRTGANKYVRHCNISLKNHYLYVNARVQYSYLLIFNRWKFVEIENRSFFSVPLFTYGIQFFILVTHHSILCIKQGMNGFMCEAAIDKTRQFFILVTRQTIYILNAVLLRNEKSPPKIRKFSFPLFPHVPPRIDGIGHKVILLYCCTL